MPIAGSTASICADVTMVGGGGVREHHRWALWPGFLRVYAWSQAGRVRGSLCPESAALLVGGGKKLNNSSSGFILSHTLC